MNSAASNIIISIGAMQLARKIAFEEPHILNYVRIAYVTTQLITLGIYFYTSAKIKAKNDLTVLKYVEPQNPMSSEPNTLVTTTYRDYDLGEVSKLLRGVYMGIAMMTFLHVYMKYTQPLFVQALMGLKNVYEAKPVALHILGRPAEGDLKRPFKTPSLFGAAAGPATDKAAIEEAEKRVGGSKEE